MESLKILVLGDLGVGKSSFLKLISEKFYEIYPINYFDYFIYSDEKEENKQIVRAKDLANNNCAQKNVETIVESMFFQAKKNFLEFIENKMNTQNFFFEERHKYTYGFEIYTFLWNKDNEYNNKFIKNIPLNMLKNDELLNNNNSLNSDDNNVLLIEFFEIGGVQTYSYIRNIFYEKHDGILLVYDSSNNKSYHNLVKWLYELYINTKPPSDIFCVVKKKENTLWNFFKKKKKKDNSNEENINTIYTEDNYNEFRNIKYNDDDFLSDENSDIEKGYYKNGDRILKGEIPIACVATKIDKKNSKEKPAFAKTPKKSCFYDIFFSDFFSKEPIYESKNNLKIKKEILKKLEHHISEAIEIKASSIDCVVDIDNFLNFLKTAYNKKYKFPKL
ncbi:ras GTPAse, putative [Plasmodium gallinaceum]|uniref:Ras GTPAse, putative n=1 Tax=Plasmodium gallinaceum TaxID=5849 RepID=A0A1J1GNB0_PLAGA|nr:ras GTPAse, putative [Plasmodium gallinaceum]CRG93749.1 ras GTPAse, putative [Plasmodium gallinaceum]